MKVAKKKRGKTAKVMKAKEQHDRVRRDKHGHKLDSSGKRMRPAGAEQKRSGSRHKRDPVTGKRIQRSANQQPRCPQGHILVVTCGACARDKGLGEDTRSGMLLDCPR